MAHRARRHRRCTLTTLILVASCLHVVHCTSQAQHLYDRAIALRAQHKWSESLALLEQAAASINTSYPELDLALAKAYHDIDRFDAARTHYERVLRVNPRDAETLMHFGKLEFDNRDWAAALPLFTRATESDQTTIPQLAHFLALCHHHTGNYMAAEQFYERVPPHARDGDYYFDFGVTKERLGKIIQAADLYNKAISLDEDDARAWLNIAGLHHLHGVIDDSFRCYEQAISIPSASVDIRVMAATNLGVAHEQTNNVVNALIWFRKALSIVPAHDTHARINIEAHIVRVKQKSCDWGNAEDEFAALLDHVINDQVRYGVSSSLMPFDTLLVAMDPRLRLKIAQIHAQRIATRAYHLPNDQISILPQNSDRLCVAYISFDFNDHPTAHLIEGVFTMYDTDSFDIVAYAYGKDDDSGFRKRVGSLVGGFVSLASASTQQSAEVIRSRGVEILMEAQVHTRGTRLQIAASKPAPIIVNYLVYPGTSGASYIDYLIADRFVTPPDVLASHVSEKLVLLPYSYQVNFYPEAVVAGGRSTLWQESEGTEGRDEDFVFTFVNFNKIDKLESRVFSLWMAIIRRVPRSRLLLLDPATRPSSENEAQRSRESPTTLEIKRHLIEEAMSHGVSPSRIQFVPRLRKHEHLRRHRHGGLFLDTLVYGAHSTATDALYAGLPVLTLAGDAFASRVGVSLLTNAGLPELVAYSVREYEDLAVAIASDRTKLLHSIRDKLRHSDSALFNTAQHVRTLEEAQRVMATLHRSKLMSRQPHTAHILVTDYSIPT